MTTYILNVVCVKLYSLFDSGMKVCYVT